MKKYDYKNIEVWFSKRALEWLTFSTPAKMSKRIHYAYMIGPEIRSSWRDCIFLKNKEGSRSVRRKMDIFNLMATAAILRQFNSRDFPDYRQIRDRIDEMKWQAFSARYINEQSNMPAYIDTSDTSNSNLEDMYIVLGGINIDKTQKRRRLITDVANDYITQYYEDSVSQSMRIKNGRLRLLEINRQSS